MDGAAPGDQEDYSFLELPNEPPPRQSKLPWTSCEEAALCYLHSRLGNRWMIIATHYEGRSESDVKNYWHSTIRAKTPTRRSALLYAYSRSVKDTRDDVNARAAMLSKAEANVRLTVAQLVGGDPSILTEVPLPLAATSAYGSRGEEGTQVAAAEAGVATGAAAADAYEDAQAHAGGSVRQKSGTQTPADAAAAMASPPRPNAFHSAQPAAQPPHTPLPPQQSPARHQLPSRQLSRSGAASFRAGGLMPRGSIGGSASFLGIGSSGSGTETFLDAAAPSCGLVPNALSYLDGVPLSMPSHRNSNKRLQQLSASMPLGQGDGGSAPPVMMGGGAGVGMTMASAAMAAGAGSSGVDIASEPMVQALHSQTHSGFLADLSQPLVKPRQQQQVAAAQAQSPAALSQLHKHAASILHTQSAPGLRQQEQPTPHLLNLQQEQQEQERLLLLLRQRMQARQERQAMGQMLGGAGAGAAGAYGMDLDVSTWGLQHQQQQHQQHQQQQQRPSLPNAFLAQAQTGVGHGLHASQQLQLSEPQQQVQIALSAGFRSESLFACLSAPAGRTAGSDFSCSRLLGAAVGDMLMQPQQQQEQQQKLNPSAAVMMQMAGLQDAGPVVSAAQQAARLAWQEQQQQQQHRTNAATGGHCGLPGGVLLDPLAALDDIDEGDLGGVALQVVIGAEDADGGDGTAEAAAALLNSCSMWDATDADEQAEAPARDAPHQAQQQQVQDGAMAQGPQQGTAPAAGTAAGGTPGGACGLDAGTPSLLFARASAGEMLQPTQQRPSQQHQYLLQHLPKRHISTGADLVLLASTDRVSGGAEPHSMSALASPPISAAAAAFDGTAASASFAGGSESRLHLFAGFAANGLGVRLLPPSQPSQRASVTSLYGSCDISTAAAAVGISGTAGHIIAHTPEPGTAVTAGGEWQRPAADAAPFDRGTAAAAPVVGGGSSVSRLGSVSSQLRNNPLLRATALPFLTAPATWQASVAAGAGLLPSSVGKESVLQQAAVAAQQQQQPLPQLPTTPRESVGRLSLLQAVTDAGCVMGLGAEDMAELGVDLTDMDWEGGA